MAERKWDLSDRRVELPDGSTFEFAWDMDVYPARRELIEEHGLIKVAFDRSVDDIIALAKMLEAWNGLASSRRQTQIGILWNLHQRLDCLLHALTVTTTLRDTGTSGLDMAGRLIADIRRNAYEVREFADTDRMDLDVSKGLGALAALLGGLGDD